MLNRFTSIKRTMALAGAAALSAGSFAFMFDTNIVIERALNSPTLTVKYDGASATLVELRINGDSFATKSVSAATNKGEAAFTLSVSDLKDGDNEVEIRLYDKTGKVVGTQKQTVTNDQANKGPVFITGPKQGATVQGVTEIKLGFGKELKNIWVSFFVDGDHRDITNTPPYVYTWDTQRESNGWHTVEAWAVDTDSNTYKSKQVRVFVNNPGGRTARHGLGTAEAAVTKGNSKAEVTPTEPKNPAKTNEVPVPKEPVKTEKVVTTKVNTVKPVEPAAVVAGATTKSRNIAKVEDRKTESGSITLGNAVAMGNQDMTPTGTRVANVKFSATTVPNFAMESAKKALNIERGTRLNGVTSFNVLLNGQYVEFDVQPRVDDGIPMTPFRHLLEKAGGKVEWLKVDKAVNAVTDGKKIWFKVGDSTARINDLPFSLELAPYIDRGRTIVPLSFMKDALDVNIQFDPATGHVLITKK
jgi:hypothetical protein